MALKKAGDLARGDIIGGRPIESIWMHIRKGEFTIWFHCEQENGQRGPFGFDEEIEVDET